MCLWIWCGYIHRTKQYGNHLLVAKMLEIWWDRFVLNVRLELQNVYCKEFMPWNGYIFSRFLWGLFPGSTPATKDIIEKKSIQKQQLKDQLKSSSSKNCNRNYWYSHEEIYILVKLQDRSLKLYLIWIYLHVFLKNFYYRWSWYGIRTHHHLNETYFDVVRGLSN